MGQVVAQQVLKQPDHVVWHVVLGGQQLATVAMQLMARAAALLDPVLAPLAGYVAATQLPPGQDNKPWAVEAVLMGGTWLAGRKQVPFKYESLLDQDPLHIAGILEELSAGLALQQAAAVQKQANKLAKAAGGGAAEAEQLRQQLQGMWLGREGDVPAALSEAERATLAAGGVRPPPSGLAGSSMTRPAAAAGQSRLPHLLHRMCKDGILKQEEVLAAGDPSRWSTALGPTSEEDLRVASTALLAACKAAGAVAQLPGLLQQLQPIMAQQGWGRAVAGSQVMGVDTAVAFCSFVMDWVLLLAPLLAVLLPVEQAAELQKAAADVSRSNAAMAALPGHISANLGLLGHVVAPGTPGCSYPGCCNMEGRSEAELRVQVCSKCKGVRYCCREHQLAHWKAGHKGVCQAAQAAAQQVQHDAATGGA
jgi:hypothetical protein